MVLLLCTHVPTLRQLEDYSLVASEIDAGTSVNAVILLIRTSAEVWCLAVKLLMGPTYCAVLCCAVLCCADCGRQLQSGERAHLLMDWLCSFSDELHAYRGMNNLNPKPKAYLQLQQVAAVCDGVEVPLNEAIFTGGVQPGLALKGHQLASLAVQHLHASQVPCTLNSCMSMMTVTIMTHICRAGYERHTVRETGDGGGRRVAQRRKAMPNNLLIDHDR